MNNLVLTIACGSEYRTVSRITHPTIRNYAKKIGADFISIVKSDSSTPHWEKFQMRNLFGKYDRIAYFDTDIIIRKDTPNIFNLVPINSVGMFNEAPYTDRSRELMIDCCREYGVTLSNWDGRYFNSGVIVASRCHLDLFEKPKKEFFSFYEQTYLNMMIAKMNLSMFSLPYKFNRMTCVDRWTGEHRLESYVVHYAGCPDYRLMMKTAKDDIESWNSGKKFKRHILIRVSGGLGDQINAEPAIRYAKENKIFGDAEISVATHWPRIFRHLEDQDLLVFEHGKFKPKFDTPYFSVDTLPGPDQPMWGVVSNLLCHTVDYCSMAVMRRTLSNEDKRVKLEVNEEDIFEINNLLGGRDQEDLVLVHAGQHWASKTFPKKWWERVVKLLLENGLNVALIGKEDDGRGTVPMDLFGVVDLRDKLSLGGLFALLSKARTLLTNDSAPVHIAGAFDNTIVLIPSCKAPHHVAPWRNGSMEYKTRVIFKKLVIDQLSSSPTEIDGVRGESAPLNWNEFLPEPEEVLEAILWLQDSNTQAR